MTNELLQVLETLDAYAAARESGAPDVVDTHTAHDAARLLREMVVDFAERATTHRSACYSYSPNRPCNCGLAELRAKWRLEP